jgi:hypothetical protein
MHYYGRYVRIWGIKGMSKLEMIRVETSKRTGIDNYQGNELSAFDRNWARDLKKKYPNATPRTVASPVYNCHGLTFASRRSRILKWAELQKILDDDRYDVVQIANLKPGDIVIYFDETGDANHSGFVVEYDPPLLLPIICSKWGTAGEFVHALNHCPSAYGPDYKFYRCNL